MYVCVCVVITCNNVYILTYNAIYTYYSLMTHYYHILIHVINVITCTHYYHTYRQDNVSTTFTNDDTRLLPHPPLYESDKMAPVGIRSVHAVVTTWINSSTLLSTLNISIYLVEASNINSTIKS